MDSSEGLPQSCLSYIYGSLAIAFTRLFGQPHLHWEQEGERHGAPLRSSTEVASLQPQMNGHSLVATDGWWGHGEVE